MLNFDYRATHLSHTQWLRYGQYGTIASSATVPSRPHRTANPNNTNSNRNAGKRYYQFARTDTKLYFGSCYLYGGP